MTLPKERGSEFGIFLYYDPEAEEWVTDDNADSESPNYSAVLAASRAAGEKLDELLPNGWAVGPPNPYQQGQEA